MDKDRPILEYCDMDTARPDVLRYLCSVFSGGLGLAFYKATFKDYKYMTNIEAQDIILDQPGFVACVNEVSYNTNKTTPLFLATLRKNMGAVLKLLSLGANPNTSCEYQIRDYEPYGNAKTPMILAVLLNQKEMVEAMAKHGGLLPVKGEYFWTRFPADKYPHIAGYLDLYESVAVVRVSVKDYSALDSIDKLRGSMPETDFPETSPNVPESETVLDANIDIDDTILSLLVQYKAESAEVLGYLDIQSLGRIQQTSRFWYHVGRSNSCWKRAFMNSSVHWSPSTVELSNKYLRYLEADKEVKWKHVCFFWASRNLCAKCGKRFRIRERTDCTEPMGDKDHKVGFLPHSLVKYNSIYEKAKYQLHIDHFYDPPKKTGE
ncbi:hypothetical protein Pelo_6128 [Pelomyxa schiedti]|nr:hypothetical protein Pelo_6128 [Pelomyxa schiedti]